MLRRLIRGLNIETDCAISDRISWKRMFAVQLNGIKYSTVCRKQHLLGVKLLGNRENERVCVFALGNCNTNEQTFEKFSKSF